jgi:hypothetical protein
VNLESSQVWYASDRRARSAHKVVVYDDIGSLIVRPNRIEFRGPATSLTISPVDRLDRSRQRWNWLMYMLANLAMSPVYALWWYFIAWVVAEPWRYVVLSALALNAVGIALGQSVTWIVVTGRDGLGQPVRAWFASGENRGWAGIFGARRELYDQVVHALQPDGPPNHPAAADGGRAGR